MIFISDKEFQLAKTELLVPYPYNSEGSYIYLLPKIIFLFTSPYHLGGYQIAASSSENFRRNSNLIYFSQIYFRLGSSSFLPVEFPFLDCFIKLCLNPIRIDPSIDVMIADLYNAMI